MFTLSGVFMTTHLISNYVASWVFQLVMVLILVFTAKLRASKCHWDSKLTEHRLTWGILTVLVIQVGELVQEYSTPDHHGLGIVYHVQWIGVYWIALALYRRKVLRATNQGGVQAQITAPAAMVTHNSRVSRNDTAKVALTIVGALALIVFCAFVWPTRYRYESAKTGESQLTIRVDRFSDKTWLLLPGAGWVATHQKRTAQQLPTVDGIKGRCSLDGYSGMVNCDIGNETDYALESLTVDFSTSGGKIQSTTTSDGKTIFVPASCRADLQGTVEPHTMGTMSITPPCAHDLKPNEWSWSIVKAWGSKSSD